MKIQRLAGSNSPTASKPSINNGVASLKVSNVPRGATSDELHSAMLEAGCIGDITDVYIPKGDRGFGFVRFSDYNEAEVAAQLQVFLRGAAVGLELATEQPKQPPSW